MRCPLCPKSLGKSSRVVETRRSDDGTTITRRRECLDNEEHRFWTIERYDRGLVVKDNGRSEPFDREKLTKAVGLAAKTITPKDIADIVDEVHRRVINKGAMSTREVGHYVLDKLRIMDEVAWVRFASVFEDFQTIGQFEARAKAYRQEERKVKKRDKREVAFDRDKLARSLHAATQRLDVDPRDVELAVDRIDREVHAGELASYERLGRLAMDELLTLHPVAWMRYASVHKGFTTLDEFKDQAERLLAKGRSK